MKLTFDPGSKKHQRTIATLFSFLIFGISVMELDAERQEPGFVALGVVIISTIVFKFSTSHRRKVVTICVWVTGMTFLMGYLLTTIILGGG